MVRVIGGSPFPSLTRKSFPKSQKTFPATPYTSDEMKIIGDGIEIAKPLSS